jgi:hypothetical protein
MIETQRQKQPQSHVRRCKEHRFKASRSDRAWRAAAPFAARRQPRRRADIAAARLSPLPRRALGRGVQSHDCRRRQHALMDAMPHAKLLIHDASLDDSHGGASVHRFERVNQHLDKLAAVASAELHNTTRSRPTPYCPRFSALSPTIAAASKRTGSPSSRISSTHSQDAAVAPVFRLSQRNDRA